MVKVLIFVVVVCFVPSAHFWSIRNPVENPSMNEVEDNSEGIKIIFPGTKWCGSGSVAENYGDLGRNNLTDACCREHDLCPDIIESGGSAHGLTNSAPYTRVSCECDMKFLKCLRKTERQQKSSKFIGIIYFDGLQTQCFSKEYPITGCKIKLVKRCVEYEFDTSGEKTWQWFDVPFY